jgi:hypothetical protein
MPGPKEDKLSRELSKLHNKAILRFEIPIIMAIKMAILGCDTTLL